MKKGILVLFGILFTVSGCSQAASYDLCGYGSMFSLDGDGFLLAEPSATVSYTINEKVGAIEKQIEEEYHPVNHLVSNHLKEGTVIYSVMEDPTLMIAKINNDEYALFEKIDE
ncbi:hypothetical protein [Cytobacillus sp. IB215665]|uniref:hypothetical protein n=1 Tax=Cytobacillus sp. IB215665 TaxID=3097357 RepID=UPI002A1040A4|nr:hypothetical protein [Cytobacillus sp. IB215665]MDX8365951.1 hypothetical protein [Cytobacillus sp. IB215665]